MTKEDRELLSSLLSVIREMDKKLNNVQKRLTPNTIRKAMLYEEIKSLPRLLNMRVESMTPSLNELGEFSIKVRYAIPEQEIRIPDLGESDWPQAILAINSLDMVPAEDIGKVADLVERYSKMQKNG